jgi:hypothetical protein
MAVPVGARRVAVQIPKVPGHMPISLGREQRNWALGP